jgi:hypothetical protein
LICDASHHTSLAATPRFPQFLGFNQVQNVNLQMAKHVVGLLHGEDALSLQHIVEMRLGNSGQPGESALGSRAAAHALPKVIEEALLQIEECHGLS